MTKDRVAWEWVAYVSLPNGKEMHIGQAGADNRERKGLCITLWGNRNARLERLWQDLNPAEAQCILYALTNPER